MTTVSSELRINLVENATKQAPAIAAAIEKMQSHAKALQKVLAASGTSDRLQASLAKLGASETHVEGVARAMRDFAKAEGLAENAAEWTKAQASNYRAMEDAAIKAVRAIKKEEAGLAHARHQQSELAEADSVALSHATRAAHEREEAIRRGGFGHFVATGAAAAVSAHGVMRITEHTVEAGAELQHVITGLKNSGRTVDEIAAIMARAGDVMKSVPTSSLKENLETILETTGAFGNLEHAMENLEFVQKATSVLKAAGDGEASSKSVAYDFAKFAEIRGSAGDSKRLQSESNEMTRGMVFTGGKFNPAEAFKFAQQTSSLLSGYSIHFLSRILPSLATEAGGERTGTRANAFANVILGKARDKKQTEEWERLGLLDRSKVIHGNAGAQGWKAGAVKETNLALSDPDVFAEKVLIPAMKAHRVNVDDPFEVKKELNQLFRNGESNRFANAIVDVLQRKRLHQDDENIGKAGDVDTIYKRNLNEDPTVAFDAVKTSLSSLMSVASQPAMSATAAGLSTLAEGISYLAVKAKDHPALAVTAAAGATAAGLGAPSYLAYKMLNGFGLGKSATALTGSAGFLDGSAAFLKEAAIKLGASAGLSKAETAAESAAGGVTAGAKAAGRVGSVLKAVPLVGTAVVLGVEAAGLVDDYNKAHPEQFKAHSDAIDKWKASVAPQPSSAPAGRHVEMDGGMHWVDDPQPIAGKRAGGGPVSHGKTYLVGEHGPELFTAGMNGAISTSDVQRLLSRQGAASAVVMPPSQPMEPRAIIAAIEDLNRNVVSGFVAVAIRVGHLDRRQGLSGERSPIAGRRAAGGPVSSGKTYLVGERGPELFTAGATGQVTKNRLLLQAVLSSRDFADRGQRTERNRLLASEVLARSPDPTRLHHAAVGQVSTSISAGDVQRLLSKASYRPAPGGGDAETAKAVRAMTFALEGAVDRVAAAVERAKRERPDRQDLQGDTPFYAGEGGGGHPRSFGGGGRRGFMEQGHGGDGPGRKGFAKRADKGPSADVPTDGDSVKVATSMLKRREGFQGAAKWDRNHLRLGYGSDTITDAQGQVREVKAGDHVTREDAERDLARRIPEFQRKVAREVGVESWKKLSPVVQGALTSMAYNYGGFSKLPTMRAAIATGDNAKIAAAIRLREGDNGGINGERREEEARVIERAGARKAGESPDPGRAEAAGKTVGAQDTGDHSAILARAQQSIGRFADATHQCVGLVTAATGNMTSVREWRKGQSAAAGGLKPGAQIATFLGGRPGDFHSSDRYADGGTGTPGIHRDHAAVFKEYAEQNGVRGMKVLEQYNKAGGGQVHEKFYPFGQGDGERNASNYNEVTVGGRTLDGHAPAAVARAPEARAPIAAAQDDPLALRRSREARGADKPIGGELHDGLSSLHGKTITPAIDNTHLHETVALLREIRDHSHYINVASAKHRNRTQDASRIAGLSSKLRGGFMHSGSQIG